MQRKISEKIVTGQK